MHMLSNHDIVDFVIDPLLELQLSSLSGHIMFYLQETTSFQKGGAI